jgi:4-hydroxy-tetrahydrodipicolinate reductase
MNFSVFSAILAFSALSLSPMNILVLGRGKTGSVAAEVARERKHHVQIAGTEDNESCQALAAEQLKSIDLVIDFTVPHCVIAHIESCLEAGKNMVVGTTGWYGELDRVRRRVEEKGTGFVYGANFSVGINLFFEIARASAAALHHDYAGQIFERHHKEKKDAPSGTAITIQKMIRDASATEKDVEIVSFREGDVIGMHEIVLESSADRIYLCHDAKSRRGFAEGAVRAAEWIAGKKGFYDFKDVWRDL